MDVDHLIAALDQVQQAAETAFAPEHDGTHEGRLGQLRSAIGVARMALQHLADEHAREANLRQRVLNGGTDAWNKHGHQIGGRFDPSAIFRGPNGAAA